jgi:hypothetical protein
MKRPDKKRALWEAIEHATTRGRAITIQEAGAQAEAEGVEVSTSMLYKVRAEWIAHGNIKEVGVDDAQAGLYVAVTRPEQFEERARVQRPRIIEAEGRTRGTRKKPRIKVGDTACVVGIVELAADVMVFDMELNGLVLRVSARG